MKTIKHGPMQCRICWEECHEYERNFHGGKYRLVNDPGYWGASDPKVLVLGMTKGTTQAHQMKSAYQDGNYDKVAFSGFRPRLLKALAAVGLMKGVTDIGPYFTATSTEWGFASIIRCSLTALDAKGTYRGNSGPVIRGMKSTQGRKILENCISTHLSKLSSRTGIVVLLGNDENYLKIIRSAAQSVFKTISPIPDAGRIAFMSHSRVFVHIGHPSPMNGHFEKFCFGDVSTDQGMKREQAKNAITAAVI